jgi:hypothetical protein
MIARTVVVGFLVSVFPLRLWLLIGVLLGLAFALRSGRGSR